MVLQITYMYIVIQKVSLGALPNSIQKVAPVDLMFNLVILGLFWKSAGTNAEAQLDIAHLGSPLHHRSDNIVNTNNTKAKSLIPHRAINSRSSLHLLVIQRLKISVFIVLRGPLNE